MKQIKILHNVTSVGKSSYGLGQISVNLARAQYKIGNDVNIWCLDNMKNISWASITHEFPNERIKGFKLLGPKNIFFSPHLYFHTRGCSENEFNIVHQHGIWGGNSCSTLHFSKNPKISTIIAPHGSLDQLALKISKYKKKVALNFYEWNNLNSASCLHATSLNEISNFRDFGLKNPIAYIENGIQEQRIYVKGNADRFRERNAIPKNERILLYLSRITPKKGLLMLIDAIKMMQEDFSDWQFIIAGNDEFNHKKEVEASIKKLGLEKRIKIIEPQFNEAMEDAFQAAELFILPSFSEGSPMVILDSLVAGVPVITTKASTWNDLIEYNCGWWTEINTTAIATALREAINMSTEDLHQMGLQGKELIASKYTWPKLAQKTFLLYDWLLGRNEKPDFVIID